MPQKINLYKCIFRFCSTYWQTIQQSFPPPFICSAEIKPWILVNCYVSLYINLIDLLTGVFIDVLCYKYADFILNI